MGDRWEAWQADNTIERRLAIHQSPPVAGYKPLSSAKVDMVNLNKEAEERILRTLDMLRDNPPFHIDHRWLAIGRTHIEEAFMAINRSIFQPGRLALYGEDV